MHTDRAVAKFLRQGLIELLLLCRSLGGVTSQQTNEKLKPVSRHTRKRGKSRLGPPPLGGAIPLQRRSCALRSGFAQLYHPATAKGICYRLYINSWRLSRRHKYKITAYHTLPERGSRTSSLLSPLDFLCAKRKSTAVQRNVVHLASRRALTLHY